MLKIPHNRYGGAELIPRSARTLVRSVCELGLLPHDFGPCHVAAGVKEDPTLPQHRERVFRAHAAGLRPVHGGVQDGGAELLL
jgi:hypothetical protein